jgi:hypothetical protein
LQQERVHDNAAMICTRIFTLQIYNVFILGKEKLSREEKVCHYKEYQTFTLFSPFKINVGQSNCL